MKTDLTPPFSNANIREYRSENRNAQQINAHGNQLRVSLTKAFPNRKEGRPNKATSC